MTDVVLVHETDDAENDENENGNTGRQRIQDRAAFCSFFVHYCRSVALLRESGSRSSSLCETRRSAEFLGESDEKPFRSADVAEPVDVLILDYFADELRAALPEPFKRVVDVVHGEHDAEVA